jgi:hypothetical protein
MKIMAPMVNIAQGRSVVLDLDKGVFTLSGHRSRCFMLLPIR